MILIFSFTFGQPLLSCLDFAQLHFDFLPGFSWPALCRANLFLWEGSSWQWEEGGALGTESWAAKAQTLASRSTAGIRQSGNRRSNISKLKLGV